MLGATMTMVETIYSLHEPRANTSIPKDMPWATMITAINVHVIVPRTPITISVVRHVFGTSRIAMGISSISVDVPRTSIVVVP